ncbi:MAG: phosphoribosylamine--glycine ligase [Acidimicrobiales bacterium]
MRIVIIGQGAREHALAWVLSKEHEIIATPGNPGIAKCAEITEREPLEIDADLFVIGPEGPLVDGLADRLRATGRAVFGPSREGAMLEGSKAFMKQVLQDAGVPTARFVVIESLAEGIGYLESHGGPYVIKTDGLAAGKGVLVTDSLDEAKEDLELKLTGQRFGGAGKRVVIEEALVGTEISVLAVTDGKSIVALPPATDFKRAFDGDLGPNTGGMGAYSPVPWASEAVIQEVVEESIEPVVRELRRRGIDYRGVLYAGMMLTRSGPKVVEFNVRFGDPETQVVVPRVTKGLGELLHSAALGRMDTELDISPHPNLVVTIASKGYPLESDGDRLIQGIREANRLKGVTVFHAGTRQESPKSELWSHGGRVLSVRAEGETLLQARERAYRACDRISFDGMFYRRDIGLKALQS